MTQFPLRTSEEVRHVLDDLVVTAARFGVVAAAERTARPTTLPFDQHSLRLALLRLRKLRRDDDEAEVDHEEGAGLKRKCDIQTDS